MPAGRARGTEHHELSISTASLQAFAGSAPSASNFKRVRQRPAPPFSTGPRAADEAPGYTTRGRTAATLHLPACLRPRLSASLGKLSAAGLPRFLLPKSRAQKFWYLVRGNPCSSTNAFEPSRASRFSMGQRSTGPAHGGEAVDLDVGALSTRVEAWLDTNQYTQCRSVFLTVLRGQSGPSLHRALDVCTVCPEGVQMKSVEMEAASGIRLERTAHARP
jgi:hypothetical protein